MDISFSCVCPIIDHEFHHNIVKVHVAVDPRGHSRVDLLTTLTMIVMTKFNVNNRADT